MSVVPVGLWFKGAVLVLVGLVVYVIAMHAHYWANVDEYSFGYLVPLFVLYVLYERWEQIKAGWSTAASSTAPVRTQGWMGFFTELLAFCCVLIALFLLLAGTFNRVGSGPNALSAMLFSLALTLCLLGVVWLLAGFAPACQGMLWRLRYVGLFLFPALIWLISAPLAPAFEQVLRVFLLGQVTHIVVFVFDLAGVPIYREGTILILPTGSVGVEDACSGIRSLTACLFAGSFLAAVFLNKLWKKVLLLVTAALLAFVTNIGRSLFLTAWAYQHGSEAIDLPAWEGGMTVHDVAGYSVLGITCIGLLLILPIFQISVEPPASNKTNRTS